CRRLRASSCSLTLFSYIHVPPPDLHSFPTRRSSDLPTPSRHAVPHGPEAHASTVVPRRTAGPAPRCSSRHRPRHRGGPPPSGLQDRKSTRLNSSHVKTSYAVFCLKKKTLNS